MGTDKCRKIDEMFVVLQKVKDQTSTPVSASGSGSFSGSEVQQIDCHLKVKVNDPSLYKGVTENELPQSFQLKEDTTSQLKREKHMDQSAKQRIPSANSEKLFDK